MGTTADIIAGTIDGATIGGSNPAPGTFSTLAVNGTGDANFSNTGDVVCINTGDIDLGNNGDFSLQNSGSVNLTPSGDMVINPGGDFTLAPSSGNTKITGKITASGGVVGGFFSVYGQTASNDSTNPTTTMRLSVKAVTLLNPTDGTTKTLIAPAGNIASAINSTGAGGRDSATAYLAPLAAPTNGTLTSTAAGSLAATTYFVKSTWVSANGETLASSETSLAVAANKVLNVAAPGSAPTGAIGWNVYISNTAGGGTGAETKQNGGTPIALGTAWVEPTSGLITGTTVPSANTTVQTIWHYFIWGATPGLNAVNSPNDPTVGPTLPSGYTHYAAAFPVVIETGVTIANPLYIAGKQAYYKNPAYNAVVSSAVNNVKHPVPYSLYVPTAAESFKAMFDAEAVTSSGANGAQGGFIIQATNGSNYLIISDYGETAGFANANSPVADVPLDPSMALQAIFNVTTGVYNSAAWPNLTVAVLGYTFPYGG